MTINGLGTFNLTGPLNECEILLKLLRLREYSYKPHMMVTRNDDGSYRFNTYDDDDPAKIVLWHKMTLDRGEKKHIKLGQWYGYKKVEPALAV